MAFILRAEWSGMLAAGSTGGQVEGLERKDAACCVSTSMGLRRGFPQPYEDAPAGTAGAAKAARASRTPVWMLASRSRCGIGDRATCS